ncbi:efflux RND transporter periplasmic adaptor subunit [Roseburia hominis]
MKKEKAGIEKVEIEKMEKDSQVKKPKKKLPGWMILPILAVLVLTFWGISLLASPKDSAKNLEVVRVEKGDVKETYRVSGLVESEKSKVFFSPVNAPIASCKAQKGQAVKAGDLLVTYDTADLERENQKSQLNVLSTKYANQDAGEQSRRSAEQASQAKAAQESSIRNMEEQVAEKKEEIQKLEAAYEEEAQAAGNNAAKLEEIKAMMQENLNQQDTKKAEKENAEREMENLDALYPEKTQQERDEIRRELVETAGVCTKELEALQITYRSLEQSLSAVGNADVSALAANLAAAKQELATLKSSLNQAKSSATGSVETGLTAGQTKNMKVSENMAELAALSAKELVELGKEGIKAEFDGIISDVKAVESSQAVQGGELFTLVSNTDVAVKIEVAAGDCDKLKEGSSAVVEIGRQSYSGTLTSIDKIALPNEKGNPVIGARVQIDDPDENIYVGVNAKVTMLVAEEKNVLCLPCEVINTGTTGDFVYVIRDGVVKKQMVELGTSSSTRVEIKEGLSEGDQVVYDSTGSVKEGMRAQAVEKSGK